LINSETHASNPIVKKLDKGDVVIATTTLYEGVDDLRFRLAYETLSKAVEGGYSLCVVDGSRDTKVKNSLYFLCRHENYFSKETTRGPGRNFGSQKRFALYQAAILSSNKKIVVWIEPEKYGMIEWIPYMVYDLLLNNADIVVATRSLESWSSYPSLQMMTEREINKNFEQHTGLKGLDVAFGPVAFHIKRAGFYFVEGSYTEAGVFNHYAQQYAVIVAHRDGIRIKASPPLDFSYPKEQYIAEEAEIVRGGQMRTKRIRQRDTFCDSVKKLAAFYNLPRQ
jgi:hypothetical protein